MDVGRILSIDSDLSPEAIEKLTLEQILSLLTVGAEIGDEDTIENKDCQVHGYYSFEPRPDQPERGDEQTAFLNCKTRGVSWLLGGNGSGTTELSMAKLSRFVYETPPPRFDTPFWVIAESYEQTMETCWKEKLYGHGHILEDDIDWDRVTWHSVKDGLPKRIPMKSPPDCPGRNWVLEFKSWNQGRGQMQARAIGGFCFVEQFPWGVFTEVLRGCREYNLPGSKFVEYTPVDPRMSGEIEEMIANGKKPKDRREVKSGTNYLPDDWEVFHANTECALEAGHIDAEWFEEFFGMVSDEMRDVRMKGLFASFEGVIYKGFNPFVHVMGDEMFDRLDGCWHRRGLDWGAGPQNPFAAVWGARSPIRQWYIYDEYYSADQDKTVIDHLMEVYQRHEWEDHPLFGLTYCDPSSPGNMRIAQKIEKYAPGRVKNFSMARGNNSVLEGIEHIRYLLKQAVPVMDPKTGRMKLEPRIFIHKSCVNTIREMRGYRWLQPGAENSANPKSPRREPLKIDDHACFVESTMISMADGSVKRISDIRNGDVVLTHLGTGMVLDSGLTGLRETVQILHEFGETRCTADHPMYHACHMDFRPISNGDVTCVLSRDTETVMEFLLKHWNGTATSGGDIRNQKFTQFASISADHHAKEQRGNSITSGCIKRFGNSILEKFQTAFIFITLMETAQTMLLKIFSCSRHRITLNYIRRMFKRLAKRLLNGMRLKRANSGILSTQKTFLQSDSQQQNTVNTAEKISPQKTQSGQPDFATLIAELRRDEKEMLMRCAEIAKCADLNSGSINTRRLQPVRMPVVESRCLSVQKTGQIEPVFNLRTTDGTYFADGILVSNCDAMRYMIFTDDGREGMTYESVKRNAGASSLVPGGSGRDGNSRWREAIGK